MQPAEAQQRGGAVTVATIGEPNTLDPMVSAGDLLGMVTQHFYETLFTFDKNWGLTPLLAEKLPEDLGRRQGLHHLPAPGRHIPQRPTDDRRRTWSPP